MWLERINHIAFFIFQIKGGGISIMKQKLNAKDFILIVSVK